jgi:hypothetical protein
VTEQPDPIEVITLHHDPERGIDLIHLPDVPYYDTQAGAVEIGLDREWVTTLRNMLDEWIAVDGDELTREDATNLADELGSQLYQAEDRLAFTREQADAATGPIDPAELVRWTNRAACMRVDPADGPSVESVVRMLSASRVSVLQAAFRELGWRIDFQLAEEKP